jgi:hypothetical protein
MWCSQGNKVLVVVIHGPVPVLSITGARDKHKALKGQVRVRLGVQWSFVVRDGAGEKPRMRGKIENPQASELAKMTVEQLAIYNNTEDDSASEDGGGNVPMPDNQTNT